MGEITRANIAASATLVGNAAKGGKWQLNSGVGQVSCGLAILPEAMAVYPGVLVSFTPATNFPVGMAPDSVAVGDFNGDGKTDLAVANNGSNSVSVLLNTTAVPEPTLHWQTLLFIIIIGGISLWQKQFKRQKSIAACVDSSQRC